MLINKNEIILYHGTNKIFDHIDLNKSKDKRDFGRGFYTTILEKQAEDWAHNMFIRYGGDGIFVMKFKIGNIEKLNIKEFLGLDKEWLNIIKANRIHGVIQHDLLLMKFIGKVI